MAIPAIAVKAAITIASDKRLRNIFLGIIGGFFGLIILLVMMVVYILSSPITLLTKLADNPEILAQILQLKTQYQCLMPQTAHGSGQYLWPLDYKYKLNRDQADNLFGPRVHPIYGDIRFHYGIDIQAPNGSNCYAIADGVVISAGPDGAGGDTIFINVGKAKDGKDITAQYCHLEPGSYSLNSGDLVKRGQQIASTGTTGQSQGGHLHFGIKADGEFVDPLLYVSDSEATTSGAIDLTTAEQVNAQITAYYDCTQKTSCGTTVTADRTVAGYPSLEMGTRIFIPARTEQPNGGVYVVEDRGGAVDDKRKVIDMWLATESECLSWGRQYLPIFVIQEDTSVKKQRIVDLGGYDFR